MRSKAQRDGRPTVKMDGNFYSGHG